MSIKSFAYQLSLKSGNQIKRSHCYELFAASQGYKTYAAIDCVVGMPDYLPQLRSIRIDKELLSARALSFGLNPDFVQAWITELLEAQPLEPFSYFKLASHIEHIFIPEIQPFVDALIPSAHNGNSMAHYCLALLYARAESDEPESDYWYRQRLSGKVLSEIESEYADEYQAFYENIRLSKAHLNAAADLGNVSAMVKLALLHDDPRVLDCKVDLITTEICLPWGVDEIAEYALSKGRRDEYHRWLALGCAEGYIEAIDQLAFSIAEEKPAVALALVKYASSLGADLTKPRTRSVDENGNDYDYDIGGAMYVEETEGVQIPTVTDAEAERAASLAGDWYRQYKEHGKAKVTID